MNAVARPPSCGRASRTSDARAGSASAAAALSPAKPPPTTTTSERSEVGSSLPRRRPRPGRRRNQRAPRPRDADDRGEDVVVAPLDAVEDRAVDGAHDLGGHEPACVRARQRRVPRARNSPARARPGACSSALTCGERTPRRQSAPRAEVLLATTVRAEILLRNVDAAAPRSPGTSRRMFVSCSATPRSVAYCRDAGRCSRRSRGRSARRPTPPGCSTVQIVERLVAPGRDPSRRPRSARRTPRAAGRTGTNGASARPWGSAACRRRSTRPARAASARASRRAAPLASPPRPPHRPRRGRNPRPRRSPGACRAGSTRNE